MGEAPRTPWEQFQRWLFRDWGRQVVYAGCYVPAIGAVFIRGLLRGVPSWAPVAGDGLYCMALLFGFVSTVQCHLSWRRGVCGGLEQAVPVGTMILLLAITLRL